MLTTAPKVDSTGDRASTQITRTFSVPKKAIPLLLENGVARAANLNCSIINAKAGTISASISADHARWGRPCPSVRGAPVGPCVTSRVAPLLQPNETRASVAAVESAAVAVPSRAALAQWTHEALAAGVRASAVEPTGIPAATRRMRLQSKKSYHGG